MLVKQPFSVERTFCTLYVDRQCVIIDLKIITNEHFKSTEKKKKSNN